MRKKWLITSTGRQCIKCSAYKEYTLFYKDGNHSTGHERCCKVCSNIRKKPRTLKRKYIRMQTDPVFRIKDNIRRRTRNALSTKGIYKNCSISKCLGIKSMDYKIYLENKFYPHPVTGEAMTWDNYGFGQDKWNIDHIKPLSSFDFTDPLQVAAAAHYTNTQPMWQIQNFAKSNKLDF